jgi:hypothetical protein
MTGHFEQGAWIQDSPDPFHPFLRIEFYAGVQEGMVAIQAEAGKQPAAETVALDQEIATMLKEMPV